MGDINGRAGRNIDEFYGVHREFSIGERNQQGRMLLEFCDANYLCIANTWLRKDDKKKVTHGSRCNKSEIIFCIIGKVD